MLFPFRCLKLEKFKVSKCLSRRIKGGGHWGILETPKPKKKIIQNRKTAYKTVKNRYNGDKWGVQSKLN